jgi:hypothetical protein
VLGGISKTGYSNALEVFDPITYSWTTPKTTGDFTPRFGCTCSVINNKIYVMGGRNKDFIDVLQVFDPQTNTWSSPPTNGTFTPRAGLTSNVIGRNIYTIGGYIIDDSTYDLTYYNLNEVFTPAPDAAGHISPSSPDPVIFPNPAHEIITVENKFAEITRAAIITTLGTTIFETANPISPELQIDVSTIPAGMYSLRLLVNGKIKLLPFVIVR